jgi:hypothetical protein
VRSLSSRLAAHDHSHLHDDDPKTDKQRNGHSHARPHQRLPWESRQAIPAAPPPAAPIDGPA